MPKQPYLTTWIVLAIIFIYSLFWLGVDVLTWMRVAPVRGTFDPYAFQASLSRLNQVLFYGSVIGQLATLILFARKSRWAAVTHILASVSAMTDWMLLSMNYQFDIFNLAFIIVPLRLWGCWLMIQHWGRHELH